MWRSPALVRGNGRKKREPKGRTTPKTQIIYKSEITVSGGPSWAYPPKLSTAPF